MFGYDIKPTDDASVVLELNGIRSTPLLPSLPEMIGFFSLAWGTSLGDGNVWILTSSIQLFKKWPGAEVMWIHKNGVIYIYIKDGFET